ncbi:MAG: helix-turn-helix domain-containing protein [Undibacterium sp.]|nr:helix-turn-helix domain-containing protein [Opitutaceae bacterium]
MLAWSPLLIQKIEIHALGFQLRKLQLNRHRSAEVAPHTHTYAQLILYLSGEGWQLIAKRRRPARSGDVFTIPPGTPHGFAQRGRSRPVCLVVDYELETVARVRLVHRSLPQSTLNELHALLARVPAKGRPRLSDYASILSVIALLLEPSAEASPARPAHPITDKVRGLMRHHGPLAKVAREAGYHPDHLNRKLKREAGVGLRELRDRLRLEHAQNALRKEPSVADAAAGAGFDDPNYFARWFRAKTGKTPSAWRG